MKSLTRIVPGVAALVLLVCAAASAQESGSAPASGNARPVEAAQGVVTQRNLSLSLAKTIAEGALAACREKGYHTAAAVVDRAGQILVILRDEQASPQVAEMARRAV